jgi:hypothetical protein
VSIAVFKRAHELEDDAERTRRVEILLHRGRELGLGVRDQPPPTSGALRRR